MGFNAGIAGFMPHHSGFPVSRDWEDIDCQATQCKWRGMFGKCNIPSIAKIGEDGKCKGFSLIESKTEKEIERKLRIE